MKETEMTFAFSVNVTPDERAILEAAAKQNGTTLGDFVRRTSIEAAETAILDRSIVSIPDEEWKAFETWVNRPAEDIPALARLARRIPSWES
jgi:uncharacterized protein (DUF1778 family)